MKALVKHTCIAAALIIIAFLALSYFISVYSAEKYRAPLAEAISAQLGRPVSINGPFSIFLRLDGIGVSLHHVGINNPEWASRPMMADIGRFDFCLRWRALFKRQLVMRDVAIEQADILLEANEAGQNNWNFAVADEQGEISSFKIVNSRVALKRRQSKDTIGYDVGMLAVRTDGRAIQLSSLGMIRNTRVAFTVNTDAAAVLSGAAFPFDLSLTYRGVQLTGAGDVDLAKSMINLSSYQLQNRNTVIGGAVTAMWDGDHLTLRGIAGADYADPADIMPLLSEPTAEDPTGANNFPHPLKNQYVFSDEPLPLPALRNLDVSLKIGVGSMPFGADTLNNVSALLSIAGGVVTIAPASASVGNVPIAARFKLDTAQSPPYLTLGVVGNDIDLGDLQKLAGMPSFMGGQAGLNIQLAGQGVSAREIVSSLAGIAVVTAADGEVYGADAPGSLSTLAKLFHLQGQDSALHCLAIRFIARGGVLSDNGILIDSLPTTVVGQGKIDLRSERVELNLRAKSNLVDIGGFIPALRISGFMAHPSYSMDIVALARSFLASLVNGHAMAEDMPQIQEPPVGQNACAYTLDHPQRQEDNDVLSEDSLGFLSKILKNVAGFIGKGALGQ